MSDYRRYSRQVILREVGVNGQALLLDSSVLVIGVGGLGSAAAQYLAGAGVGHLLLADRDRLELSNLQRQTLYRYTDVGRSKTDAAAAQLRELNADVEIDALDADAWPAAIAEVDVVLDCTDNFPTRFAINQACVNARKPLVSAAAIRWEGQLAVFDLRRGGPCYRCLYPELGEVGETCEEAGILGPVVGAVGCMQALSALKLLLGLDAQTGRLQTWDALQMSWRSHKISPDPECPVCGNPT
ncbi:HesA/MoeB/ThiF family protein [Sinimarinibacterium sp. CAU 1509]|uniref:HesA/MoeB/ThiF family protein n=1 Tax=Sinimarinibacterium sp. CAU 1509 TaxID=2562283 RepID=UPI0010AD00FC|nr:HesA/MoeB/ThiF family protein [Sinimarinibacterium sp. CAU 1509]TJY61875.1 HesA/MoeB/ThiF family protein [Sinimarinibacterium sp. CAU 1509]